MKKITNWKENPACAAAVSWENGTESTYRLGYHGKVSTEIFKLRIIQIKTDQDCLIELLVFLVIEYVP